jgi:hypothetical protein
VVVPDSPTPKRGSGQRRGLASASDSAAPKERKPRKPRTDILRLDVNGVMWLRIGPELTVDISNARATMVELVGPGGAETVARVVLKALEDAAGGRVLTLAKGHLTQQLEKLV